MNNRAEMKEHIEKFVAKGQWVIQSVFPDIEKEKPAFAYTVGLTSLGIKELVITGNLPQHAAETLLNLAAKHLIDNKLTSFQEGQPVSTLASLPLTPMNAESDFIKNTLYQANTFYGHQVQAQQLVWPDTKGRFPWEKESEFSIGGRFHEHQPALFKIH
jgi:hypothetical protein